MYELDGSIISIVVELLWQFCLSMIVSNGEAVVTKVCILA